MKRIFISGTYKIEIMDGILMEVQTKKAIKKKIDKINAIMSVAQLNIYDEAHVIGDGAQPVKSVWTEKELQVFKDKLISLVRNL